MDESIVNNAPPNDPAAPGSVAPAGDVDRRTLLKKVAALVVGGIAVMVPLGAGLATFFNPLRKRGGAGAAARSAQG
jgi:hypothetical protein